MQKEVREAFRVRFKWTVFEYAKVCRFVIKACREFEVPRSTFYNWIRAFDKEGKAGLTRKNLLRETIQEAQPKMSLKRSFA